MRSPSSSPSSVYEFVQQSDRQESHQQCEEDGLETSHLLSHVVMCGTT